MAEEVGDGAACAEAFRAGVEASAADREYWRESEGIEIDSVGLEGEYPETELAVVFPPVPAKLFGKGQFDCQFGYRVRIWPAEYTDPEHEARFWSMFFGEFLGKDLRARPIWYGPCDPQEVTWLT